MLKDSEQTHVGALIIRMGFWGRLCYTVIIIGSLHNSIGKYLGPYIIP